MTEVEIKIPHCVDWLLTITEAGEKKAINDRGCNLDVNEKSLLNIKQPNFLWKHRPKYVLSLCPQSKQIFRFSLLDILSTHDSKSSIINMFFGCLKFLSYCLNFSDVTTLPTVNYTNINNRLEKNEYFSITSVNLMRNICWKRNIQTSWNDLCLKLCVSPFWVIYTGTVVREQRVILAPMPFSGLWVNLQVKIIYSMVKTFYFFPQILAILL